MNLLVSEPVSADGLTALLRAWSAGNSLAFEQLIPLVYDELCRLAHWQMRGERAGHTWQTTGLVNEAWLRLLEQRHVDWQNREQFFAIAAREMQRLLTDYARQRNAQRRGGGWLRVQAANSLATDDVLAQAAATDYEQQLLDYLAFDEALERLRQHAPKSAQTVEFRLVLGFENKLIAETLSVAEATVTKRFKYGYSFLLKALAARVDEKAATPDESDGGTGSVSDLPPQTNAK